MPLTFAADLFLQCETVLPLFPGVKCVSASRQKHILLLETQVSQTHDSRNRLIISDLRKRMLCYSLHVERFIRDFSRNWAVFFWKSANLIGSLTVFYPPIEKSRARVTL